VKGNEYGIAMKIILPNSNRINIINIYLPPTSSLTKRNIPEDQATSEIEDLLDSIQPQLPTILCGDLNTRIGNRIPSIEEGHPERISADNYICKRAPWLLYLCTTY
jgi:exonuclease III